ncbi:MAG TPA: serine/threonine protein phosphatase, partial [Planctomicrobium sp.]|nr:serine/threonine protein phosphatase [Planctomicrobium sp.]
RKALITSHMGWGPLTKPAEDEEFRTLPKGRMQWSKIHGARGNSSQQMWEKCYQKHPHLLAVFSGDQSRSQAIHASNAGDHGNTIHEFLSDYMQATTEGGWLRLYRFSPDANKIEVFTFHPVTEELCEGTKLIKSRDQHQFEVPCKLR